MCLLRGTGWIFIYNSTFCPHSVFMCFVWIWEQTAIISVYSINWLVFITETECVYCAVRTGSLFIILRSAHTVYLCVLCGSENKQRLFPYTALTDWVFYARTQNFGKQLLASLCLSIRVEQLGSLWTDFHEIWYLRFKKKSVEKIQVRIKSDKNNRYLTRRPMHIYDSTSLNSSPNEKCFRQEMQRQSQDAYYVQQFFPTFVLFMR